MQSAFHSSCVMFMICFCTNLKGIHNNRSVRDIELKMFMICFCTNLKGIHNTAGRPYNEHEDVYDMLLY